MQVLANGLAIGAIYALVASGLMIIFGILEVPDFALGGRLMVGAYMAWLAVDSLGVNYWLGLLLAAVVAALLGLLSELLVYRRLRHASHLAGFVGALGLLIFMETAVQLIWGSNYHKVPTPLDGEVSHILGASVPTQRLVAGGIALVLIAALHGVLRYTKVGNAVRATIEDSTGALLVGISPGRVATVAIMVGSALAGIAGALLAPIYLVYPLMGTAVVTKAFIIIIMAGMRSNLGVLAAAMILGIAESTMSVYVSAGFTDAYGFGLLILVLLLRPQGLFTRSAEAR